MGIVNRRLLAAHPNFPPMLLVSTNVPGTVFPPDMMFGCVTEAPFDTVADFPNVARVVSLGDRV